METGDGDNVIPGTPLDITRNMFVRYGIIRNRARWMDRALTGLFMAVLVAIFIENLVAVVVSSASLLLVFCILMAMTPSHSKFIIEFLDNAAEINDGDMRNAYVHWGTSRLSKSWFE